MTELLRNIRARTNAAFRELETKTDAVLSEGMMQMAAAARRRSVDPEVSASIHTVGPVTDKRGRRTVMVIAGDSTTVIVADNGKKYQKARLQEFGTRFEPALPFMRPAYRDVAPKIKSKLARTRRAFLKSLNK